ncbi:hypothetical protein ABZ897_22185 [Nonomuraea sp. NPDC046802]|uniref:hypothetical protein n=1 Tax=Nonomuraea sp. NPDC046802 TaxID=3154919 RepID=UPI0033D74D8A
MDVRRRPWILLALALALTGCGSATPPPSVSALFGEYARSTAVKGDKFRGETSEDRLAQFASEGTPDQVLEAMMAARPCDHDCLPDSPVKDTVTSFASAGGESFKRDILVKRHDGRLELMTLYIAHTAGGKNAALIDPGGRHYTGGLNDFRENNELLGSEDWILTHDDITGTSGKGKVVVVSGSTRSPWSPGLIALLGLGGVALIIGVTYLSRASRDDSPFDQDNPGPAPDSQ